MTTASAICKLCLQEKPLQKSHIIPEFLNRTLYGRTHQMRIVHFGKQRITYLRKGLREPTLCRL
jgi:hypothetical protein